LTALKAGFQRVRVTSPVKLVLLDQNVNLRERLHQWPVVQENIVLDMLILVLLAQQVTSALHKLCSLLFALQELTLKQDLQNVKFANPEKLVLL
jgi:hypothetical protein